MSFYLKKTFIDPEPGIELVNLHYTWTPVGLSEVRGAMDPFLER